MEKTNMAEKTSKQTNNIEASLDELEKLVEQMESGKLSMEESLATFENGIKLTQKCQKSLDEAEQKIHKLIEENKITDIEQDEK
jgi:exodeoxyribonuclease VII small subunit